MVTAWASSRAGRQKAPALVEPHELALPLAALPDGLHTRHRIRHLRPPALDRSTGRTSALAEACSLGCQMPASLEPRRLGADRASAQREEVPRTQVAHGG